MTHRSAPVSDLIIRFGDAPDDGAIAGRLGGRAGLASGVVSVIDAPWGRVWIQRAWADGSGVDRLPPRVIVGRASVRSGFRDGPVSPDAWLGSNQGLGDGTAACQALSGMFAAFEFDPSGVSVLTDRMGFRPVYVVRDAEGRARAMGTDAEAVALAGGVWRSIDEVSVAELFVHNFITFPYTTREGMTELDPASITRVDGADRSVRTRVLWEPTEPDRFDDASKMRARIIAAMREAGSDLTAGCRRVGVLLSGGIDSRAVLASMPEGLDLAALTYVTRENNEVHIAKRLASIAGVEHIAVRRGEDFYPNLLARGLSLLGCELRGNCHGLCLVDNGLNEQFDAIIGGQLSDTFLKDHFMDAPSRMRARPASPIQKLRHALFGHPADRARASRNHTTGRHLHEPQLTEPMRARVAERRERRLAEVARVRPTTAAMWTRFWPCSRQDDSAHTLGNARFAWSDTLFAHSGVVEVMRDLSPECRVDGRVANAAFAELCGPLASVENANTGLPIDADLRAQRQGKQRPDIPSQPSAEPSLDDPSPWNAVRGSWVNPVVMQQRSPAWIQARASLAGSPALAVLDRVIDRGGRAMIASYQDDLPSNMNHIGVQIALWLDGILGGTPPGCPAAAETTA
ncbi:MAG: hypothetical protein D6692_01130 [Planctomycetota bacterium]|nr:MAG: hypothetical protein D6692_01130 [Planctomycetota bacterium]